MNRHQMTRLQIDAFCTALQTSEHSPNTIQKYRRDLSAFYAWLPPEKQVDKELVLSYKAEKIQQYATSSLNSMLAALRSFFNHMEWYDCNVKLLKVQRRIFTPKEQELSRSEYERLVTTAESRGKLRLSLLLQIMASTGIRVSEIPYITVEAVKKGKAEISLKGKIRVVWLPGKLCRKLLKYARKAHITSGAIMCTRQGRALNRKEIWVQMKSLCRAAEVDAQKVFPHNLRHLFARLYYTAQHDIVKLADLLGHSNVETTRIYLRTNGEEHLHSIEQLGLIC